jgi:hypothetical protein
VRLKGVNFRGTIRAVERRFGVPGRDRLLAAVRGPAGDALRAGEVLPGGWYPPDWFDALLDAAERTFPGPNLLRTLAHDAIRDDFTTIFKVLSIIATPESALRNATRIMARYVEGGRIRVISSQEGAVRYRFEDYGGFTARMWDEFTGGMEGILDLMKVRRLPSKTIDGGKDGDGFYEVLLRYER